MQEVRTLLRRNRGFLIVLLALCLVRGAVADWNPIPSGSMRPTLVEGDVVFVNRLAYDLKLPLTNLLLVHMGDPRRGDIVTFWSPSDPGRRLIKRVMGLPGDTVTMRDRHLIINGRPVDYLEEGKAQENVSSVAAGNNHDVLQLHTQRLIESTSTESHHIQWLQGDGRAADFSATTIPPGMYLVLGDNRDNSADSRFIGLVPRFMLIGKALRILVSDNFQGNWAPRFDRFGKSLYH